MDYDFCKHILLFCVLSVSGVSKEECQKEVWRENKQMYEYETVYCAYYEIINGTCIDSTVDSLRRTPPYHFCDDIYDDGYGRMIGGICTLLILLLLLSLVIFCLTCICWKYEVSCKKRERRSVHTVSTHPNEFGNNPPQGETHQYDEVDDGFLNRESSVNDGYDVRNSGKFDWG
ncbi:unnamed protein product [Mytilus edulis]|uniref:Uncharacterized protein n=1 Tax=Mytilus edulis TaxID=6550 RepID=A0A8S3SDI8_MYTED|nr:unnamed protein product [Mytilus edulis]